MILFNQLNKNDRLFVNPLPPPYLGKTPDHLSCRRRLILTYDEEDSKLPYINTPVIYWTNSNMKTLFIDLIVIVVC